ncbi:MAG TPA: SBBP repeat-containing protein [bacterium]|nr:SBBP repeat-containing protein [bacterium]
MYKKSLLSVLLFLISCENLKYSDDAGNFVHVDKSGNIYVSGYTEGDLDKNSNVGGKDIFLSKFNSDGNKLWTKQWGSNLDDYGRSSVSNDSGDIYVTGYTKGSFDGYKNSGKTDSFLTKFNVDGKKLWTKQWGGNSSDYGKSVVAEGSDYIYVVGETEGEFDYQLNYGYSDIFITKFDADGKELWTKLFGTEDSDLAKNAAMDDLGNIYITGYTFGCFDNNECYEYSDIVFSDIFLSKISNDGSILWTKQWGTELGDYGSSLKVYKDHIYIAGYTNSDLDNNISASPGGEDIFVTKFNTGGDKKWTKQIGTASMDYAFSLSLDSSGNIYVTGSTHGEFSDYFNSGNTDIVLIKLNSEGTVLWTKQWGTKTNDIAFSIANDKSDNLFITGSYNDDLDYYDTDDENRCISYSEIFLTKLSSSGDKIWNREWGTGAELYCN